MSSDSQWVEMEALVEAVHVEETHLHLELMGARDFRAFIPGFSEGTPVPTNWVDARVRVHGVWATEINVRGQLVGHKMFVPSTNQIRVLAAPGIVSAEIPVQPAASALAFRLTAGDSRRIKVIGVVTARPSPKFFYIQDASGGLRVHSRQVLDLHVGEQVEVVGFAHVDHSIPQLEEAVVRVLGHAPQPEPMVIDPTTRGKPDELWEGLLSRIEGEVIHVVPRGEHAELVFRVEDEFVSARLPGTNAVRLLSAFNPLSRVSVTGVCSLRNSDNNLATRVQLVLRSVGDITLLKREPWWTVPKALGALALASLLLGYWRLRAWQREAKMEARYRMIFENASDLVCTLSGESTILDANPAWTALTGHTLGALTKMRLGDMVTAPYKEVFEGWWARLIAGEAVGAQRVVLNARLNRIVQIEMSSRLVKTANGALRVESIARDVTERAKADDALRESEQRFRELAESIEEVFWVTDADKKRTLYISPAYEKTFGRTCQSLYDNPQTWFEAIQPGDRERVLKASEALQQPGDYDVEYRISLPDGATRWIDSRAFPVRNGRGEIVRLVTVAVDSTRHKNAETRRSELETQLRQAQKLEAIGTLAGGIAHDFNNILAAILINAEFARSDMPAEHPTQESISEIVKASMRARDLVRQILTFSRRQAQELKTVDPKAVLTEVHSLLRASLPATIEIRLEISPDVPSVVADSTQIHQAVMNLGANSAHAMRGKPGRLELTLDTLEVERSNAGAHGNARPGKYVRFGVADNGHGMDAVTMERIFDPFFTTKELGEGTGLGLAVVHGIMENHQGAVTVSSVPGQGTRFHLYFPATAIALTASVVNSHEVPQGKGEHVLCVDDEPSLILVQRRALERLNYRVTVCKNGQEALEQFQATPDDFSVVLTDLTMPGMTGVELASKLRELRPGLPIILTSGYTGSLNEAMAREYGVSVCLGKPCPTLLLAETLRRLLDGPGVEG